MFEPWSGPQAQGGCFAHELALKDEIPVGGLLVLIAATALVMNLLRPPDPPDEGEAILLAKAHLAVHNEFDYPNGYWTRTEWNQRRGSWRVGFLSAGKSGYVMLVEVSRDRSCRTASMDFSFFDLR